jgi:hypothetical protein
MKVDKDPFPTNMRTVDLDEKVLVRPSQFESTKGKEILLVQIIIPRATKSNLITQIKPTTGNSTHV